MNKNTYEAYEFLQANSTETNADQFFVVQDDGTFLINRQVQYVAQVQDVKDGLEDVQPCTVYDVSSQQFFVDVDNSTELISVSDQFILPDGGSGLFNNSYLLQPTSSDTTVEQMDEDLVVDQYKETNAQESDTNTVTQTSKQTNNFTEITLNDEQYQTLEQKGWILLESNDKIYVLDTLGLHDITSNEKLIHKLKNDIQHTTGALEAGCVKLPNIAPQTSSNQLETVEFVIRSSDDQDSNSANGNIQFVVDEKEIIQDDITKQNNEAPPLVIEPESKSIKAETVNSELQECAKSLKIKTKLKFADIPDKIILGKTVTGKKLVAKVTKRQLSTKNDIKTETPKEETSIVYEDTIDSQYYNVTGLFESEFVNIIQQSARGRTQDMCTPEDITSADTIVTELLKVPSMKKSLIGQNLVITKIAAEKGENGVLYNKSKVKMVTGRVISKDNICAFEHIPNMMQTITPSSDGQTAPECNDMNAVEDSNIFAIFHIHITETKCIENIVRVSVTLNKRRLPENLVNDLRRRYPSTVFACGACAAMFKSENALKEHQESKCLDSDDTLTIDTDTNAACSIVKGENDKMYACTLCEAKFNKLSNCQRHVKTHAFPSQESETDAALTSTKPEDSPKRPIQIYKCKMCPSTYFHPSTLSKHIVTRHINVKS